ncbi:Uncharacterised protein [Mycobacteroides abscessus subsp. abscessus]|nr:Uncharacterised protein [Mycobacteroides abscessus subsp. abscessus]
MVTCLYQDFNIHVIWNMTFFNQFTGKIEVNLRCRWETNFDMLKTNFHKHLEHFEFLFDVHWLKDRLVTVT